jgi:hypothetical protein
MPRARASLALRAALALGVSALVHCGSASTPTGGGAPGADGSATSDACFPDSDGINGGEDTFVITVDDTGFSKTILATQNDAQATVTLTNTGTKPHGFKVGCVSVLSSYPNLPSGCPRDSCFASNAEIPPLAPGESATITFDTPTPDNLIYPFTSNEAADSDVPGLNDGQWALM